MGWRRRWSAESWWGRACLVVAAAALAVFCVAALARALTAGDRQLGRLVEQTQVWSAALAGLGVSARLAARASRPPALTREAVEHAAGDLRKAVLRAESEQRARLLGTDHPDTRKVDVRFRRHDERRHDDTAGGADSGSLSTVFDYFRGIPSRRLVIVGEPGSGKTVLAVELLVRMLEARADGACAVEGGAAAMVPVRFSLSTWMTDRHTFEDWLANQLADRYHVRPAVAASLVADRRILPILDGLDEMDPDDGRYRRATAALRSLNDEYLTGSHLAPVVVTCRQARYAALRGQAAAPGGLDQAPCVAIQPLDSGQISRYLHSHLRTRAEEAAWAPVMDDLARPAGSALAGMLDTPWRLTLSAAVYRAGDDPADLLRIASRPDAAARMSALLISRFTHSAVALHPRPQRRSRPRPRRYTAPQVTAWLGVLAAHLAVQADAGRSGLDIAPYELWRLAGRRVRALHVACTSAVGVFLVVMSIGVLQTCTYDAARWLAAVGAVVTGEPGTSAGLWLGTLFVMFLLVPGLILPVFRSGWDPHPVPHRLSLHALRTRRGLGALARRLASWVSLGAAAGTVEGLTVASTTTGRVGLAYGADLCMCLAVFGAISGLTATLTAPAARAATPYEPMRQDLAFGLLCALGVTAVGLTGQWTASRLATNPLARAETGAGFWLTIGLLAWLSVGLGFGLAVFSRARVRYTLAVLVLAARGLLPLRLASFLGWAYDAGLLRTSGTAYQFRHRELQDRLTPRAPRQPTGAEDAGHTTPAEP